MLKVLPGFPPFPPLPTQYALEVRVPATGASTAVWVLLTRHQSVPYNEAHREGAPRAGSGEAFLTVHLFSGAAGGRRAFYLEKAWQQGVYSNRPHTLVKFDLPPAPAPHSLTLALAQFELTDAPVDYTLDVYAQAHFSLRPLPAEPAPAARASGAWRGASAGGSPNHDTHVDNPRFWLDLPSAADVTVELECQAARGRTKDSAPDVQVGFLLRPQPSGGAAAVAAPPLTSGDFRLGYCRLTAALPAGKYVIVPSTFEPGVECGFELRVAAGAGGRCNLVPAPAEARGLERRVIRGEWDAATAVGSPNHGAYWRNPQLRFTLARRAELLLRLRVPCTDRHAAPPVNVALFGGAERLHEGTGRSLSRAHAVSEGGVYAYPPGGACLPRMWLEPGSYVCVPSTFDPFVGPWELMVHATEGALRVEAFR